MAFRRSFRKRSRRSFFAKLARARRLKSYGVSRGGIRL